jgi:hypothetical protein
MLELVLHPWNTVLFEDPKRLTSNFNWHLAQKILVCADEALFAGNKSIIGKLKSTITAERMLFEAKGFDAVWQENYLRLIIISNDEHVLHVARDERRYLVLETANTYAQQRGESLEAAAARRRSYFDAISRQMKTEGGAEAMLHELLKRDIGDFDPRVIPDSPFLDVQKELSREPHEQWWAQKLEDGGRWFTDPYVEKTKVQADFSSWLKDRGYRQHGNPASLLGLYLCGLYGQSIGGKARPTTGSDPVPVYYFPNLQEAREVFAMQPVKTLRKIRVTLRR